MSMSQMDRTINWFSSLIGFITPLDIIKFNPQGGAPTLDLD